MYPPTRVDYTVEVRISGLSLLLLSIFGDGRSMHDLLIGEGGEWGPAAQLHALPGGAAPQSETCGSLTDSLGRRLYALPARMIGYGLTLASPKP